MNKTIRTLTFFISAFLVLGFTVFMVNQTAQMVQLATSIHPTAGTVTLYVLLGTYGVLTAVPVVLVIRLPRPLTPPSSREGPDYQRHLDQLRARLKTNNELGSRDLPDERSIREAIDVLDKKAVEIVKATARQVFLSTAVSQSGRLDTVLVLTMQTRMVWKIAHLYHQRPTPRDMTHLYANVAGTAFVAGELQDVDLSEQIEPIFSAVLGSLGGAIPGLQLATSILANSVLSGAADAFLTLRVGLIAKRYSGALVLEQPSAIRQAATAEAAGHLGAIVAEGSSRLTQALWRSSRDKVSDGVKDAYGKLLTAFDRIRKKPEAEAPV